MRSSSPVAGGEHEDGRVREFADSADHFEAVDVGKDDVKEDAVGMEVADHRHRVGAGAGFKGRPATALQGEANEATDARLVINDEDRGI